MNSLFQQLSQQNSLSLLKNNKIQTLINSFKTSTNPEQLVNNLLKNNPQLYSLLQNSKKSPRQLFYEIAQQKGVNPQSILELLKN